MSPSESSERKAVPNVTLNDVQYARENIKPFVHTTPVITSSTIDGMLPSGCARLLMKCENLQKVGAFKFRGATNAILSVLASPEFGSPGSNQNLTVVTHSSGNHAQALALAARQQGVRCHVVMPSNAPNVKRAAVEGYGAAVTLCEPTLEARERTAEAVMAKEREAGHRVEFVPPYDDVRVISGQGTMALEFLEQASAIPGSDTKLDVLITPVGGGGMLSGCAVAVKGIDPGITVLGAEPVNADDAQQSFRTREFQPAGPARTIADGLLTSLGDITFPLILRHVDDIFTVTEEQIIMALKLCFERLKLVVEPSAAVPLAVVLYCSEFAQFVARLAAEKQRDVNIGIVFSGGNVELGRVLKLLADTE